MRSRSLFLLGAALFLSELASSESLTTILKSRDDLPDLPECTFEGNSDFYGIGVRVGFYLTWISGLVAFVFNPEDSEGQADAQTIFLLANLIAAGVLQVQSAEETNVVVPILIFYMFFGGSVIGITSATASLGTYKNARRLKKVSVIVRQIFVQLTFMGMLFYSFYFWVKGFQKFKKFPDVCGGTFVFPVAKRLSLDRPSGGSVLALFFLVLFYLVIWLVSYKRLRRSYGNKILPWSKIAILAGDQLTQTPPWDARQRKWTIAGGVLIGFTIVWSIAAIELTIIWNKITGVNDLGSTGQLIPFVIGIASIPSAFWGALVYRQDKKEEEIAKQESHGVEMLLPEKPQVGPASPSSPQTQHLGPSSGTPSYTYNSLLNATPQPYMSVASNDTSSPGT